MVAAASCPSCSRPSRTGRSECSSRRTREGREEQGEGGVRGKGQEARGKRQGTSMHADGLSEGLEKKVEDRGQSSCQVMEYCMTEWGSEGREIVKWPQNTKNNLTVV